MVGFIVLLGLLCGVAGVKVALANRAAARDFGSHYCWLKQGRDTVNLRELEFATTGYLVPNPFALFNRRLMGLGMEDPAVLSPHFAVLAQDADGTLKVWGWSLRKRNFWRDENGTIDKFVSEELRETCKQIIAQN